MADFQSLRTSVFDLLGRPQLLDPNGVDVTQVRIKEAINEALRFIQRVAPSRAIEKFATLNFGVGVQKVALPSDYREVISVVKDGNPLTKGDFELMLRAYGNQQGTPVNYSILGTDIYLFPTPSSNVTITLYYRCWLPDLVNDTDTNWYTVNAPDAIRFKAAAILARRLVMPDEVAIFEEMANQAIQALQATIIAEQAADAPRTMRTTGGLVPAAASTTGGG